MSFVSVMLVPLVYYLCIPLWLCQGWRDRFQFWAGCALYTFCGPFINISVLLYSCLYMDSFGWGKTRKVIAEEPSPTLQLESAPETKTMEEIVTGSSSSLEKGKPINFEPANRNMI